MILENLYIYRYSILISYEAQYKKKNYLKTTFMILENLCIYRYSILISYEAQYKKKTTSKRPLWFYRVSIYIDIQSSLVMRPNIKKNYLKTTFMILENLYIYMERVRIMLWLTSWTTTS